MWGSFKSYFGQYPAPDNKMSQQNETDDIEGWVFVDMSGKEVERETVEATNPDSPLKNSDSRLNPLPLLDISNTSSAQSSPQLSPTKTEDGWLIAPPPCFTMKCSGILEISPLEDLLIEHPSMSVYGQIPEFLSKKTDESSNVADQPQTSISIETESRTNGQKNDAIQNLIAKPLPKETVCIKSAFDLKDFLAQTENMKPAQQAKWESDQYKLCPSYINRQNRVHRYQSRKHHNQKKKSLAKPFAEKGRHSF